MAGRVSIVAIDGPVAAGKTTVGKALAIRLGYRFLDTGLMYRAVTWLALQRGVSIQDTGALVSLAQELDFRVTMQEGVSSEVALINGQDVTTFLKGSTVEEAVSKIAAVAGVREALVVKQRALAKEGAIVMVGRDIGTNVLPDAPIKVYLDASPEERAQRRYREHLIREETVGLAAEQLELERRDQLDQERAVAPLRIAEDAKVVVTDGLDVEEVTQILVELVES